MNSEVSFRSTDSTPEDSETLSPSSATTGEDSAAKELSSPSTAADHNTSVMNSESSPRSTDSTPQDSETLPPCSSTTAEDSATDELSSASTAADHNTSNGLMPEEAQAEAGTTASGEADNSTRFISLLTRLQAASHHAGANAAPGAAATSTTTDNAKSNEEVISQVERDRRRWEILAPVLDYFVDGVLRANYIYKLRQRQRSGREN